MRFDNFYNLNLAEPWRGVFRTYKKTIFLSVLSFETKDAKTKRMQAASPKIAVGQSPMYLR